MGVEGVGAMEHSCAMASLNSTYNKRNRGWSSNVEPVSFTVKLIRVASSCKMFHALKCNAFADEECGFCLIVAAVVVNTVWSVGITLSFVRSGKS